MESWREKGNPKVCVRILSESIDLRRKHRRILENPKESRRISEPRANVAVERRIEWTSRRRRRRCHFTVGGVDGVDVALAVVVGGGGGVFDVIGAVGVVGVVVVFVVVVVVVVVVVGRGDVHGRPSSQFRPESNATRRRNASPAGHSARPPPVAATRFQFTEFYRVLPSFFFQFQPLCWL